MEEPPTSPVARDPAKLVGQTASRDAGINHFASNARSETCPLAGIKMTKILQNATAAIVVALLMTTSVLALPTSVAHKCANHEPAACNAGDCPDGEYHDHTDYNEDEEDYHCSSEARPPGPHPDSCHYYNLHHPPTVCRLLGENDTKVMMP